MKEKQENIYQREASLAKKKKVIRIVTIVAIVVIALAIFVVAVVMDSKENETKKQALVQNEQIENGKGENKEENSQQKQDSQNNNSANNQTQNNQTKPKALVSDEKMDVYTDSEGNQAPIPKGYAASGVNKEGLVENKISTGLVIYEGEEAVTNTNVDTAQKTRNQYVWVPVPKLSEMYEIDSNGKKWGKLYDFGTSSSPKNPPTVRSRSSTSYREPDILTGYDKDSKLKTYGIGIKTAYEFEIQLEKEFNEMIASIEKYGGFYIGRYETGNWHGEVPVVVKGNNDIAATKTGGGTNADPEATWYAMYQKSKKLAGANVNVRTSMIWGSQWDRTLKWLVESGSKTYSDITDSRSWGNYKDSTGDAATGSYSKRPTGYSEYWKANNIYDMAGNVYDWTIEASYTIDRVKRRGQLRLFGSEQSCFE